MNEENIDRQYTKSYRVLLISINILLILSLSYFFMTHSFLRPLAPWWKESLCVLAIMLPFYLNYFVLYPHLFRKGKQVVYLILIACSILVASIIEVQIILPDMGKYFKDIVNVKFLDTYIKSLYIVILFRDILMIAPWILYKMYGREDKFIKKRINTFKLTN